MKRPKRFILKQRNNKIVMIIVITVLIFPLLVGAIYALPLPQVIAVESGDLLAYYGTSLGILGSFITYQAERKRTDKERTQNMKPIFAVEVCKCQDVQGLYNINITNLTEKPLSYLYLFDEFVSTAVSKKYSFKVMFCQTNANQIQDLDFNITTDPEIMDNDDYPKYVQILCEDLDGHTWNCCYYKVKNGNQIYYYPREIEML